jgi:hypothetical protein
MLLPGWVRAMLLPGWVRAMLLPLWRRWLFAYHRPVGQHQNGPFSRVSETQNLPVTTAGQQANLAFPKVKSA